MNAPSSWPGAADARRFLALLFDEPGRVVEVRALAHKRRTMSGYFDNADALVAAAAKLDGHVPTVYVLLNPPDPRLLARACNRVKDYADHATSDAEVMARRWLLVDLDPTRPAGISSSDQEHAASLERAREVRDSLRAQGWPDPVVADSGNGGHLLYRIDLPREDGGLVDRVLKALAFRFDDAQVTVDPAVFNPARISKLYGTVAGKGDDVPDHGRPHRRARLLEVPETLATVDREALEALARTLPAIEPPAAPARPGGGRPIDVGAWLMTHGLEVARSGPWHGGTRWVLASCPWNAEHGDRSAYVVQFESGAVSAGCHHGSCAGKGWKELRALFERPRTSPRSGTTRAPRPEAPAGPPREREPGEDEQEVAATAVNPTDLGNARRLVTKHGMDLRHCGPLRGWLTWDGRRWAGDETGEVVRRAKATVGTIFVEAAETGVAEERGALLKHALKSESEPSIRRMVTLAESESGVAILPAALDTDPWALTVQNGTLDLRSGALRPHRREDLITKASPVAFDPSARAPTWEAFLERVMGGRAELVAFLRRAVGYSLTGSTREHAVFLCHGAGANGKSTFLEVLRHALGDHSTAAEFETFLKNENRGGAREDLARLRGARLVTAVEAAEGRRLDEAALKQLTGGDLVTARFLYSGSFEFYPTCKIWFACNHKPVVRGDDQGIWRRLNLIPFNVVIPPEERDKELGARLRAEASGILAWAVRGCLEWQEQGLAQPRDVQAATAEYKSESDRLGEFLDECCVFMPEVRVSAQALYDRYVKWCEARHERAQSLIGFAMRLKARGGLEQYKDGYKRAWYRGIGLRREGGSSEFSASEDPGDSDPAPGNFSHTRAHQGSYPEQGSRTPSPPIDQAGFGWGAS